MKRRNQSTIKKDPNPRRSRRPLTVVAGVNACWACSLTTSHSKPQTSDNSNILGLQRDIAQEQFSQSKGRAPSQVKVYLGDSAQLASIDCGHRFKTKLSASARPTGQGCPLCYVRQRGRLCVNLDHFPQARKLFHLSRRNGGFGHTIAADYRVFWSCRSDKNHIAYLSFLEFKELGYLCPACHKRRALVDEIQAGFLQSTSFQKLAAGVDYSPYEPLTVAGPTPSRAYISNYKPKLRANSDSAEGTDSAASVEFLSPRDTSPSDLHGGLHL